MHPPQALPLPRVPPLEPLGAALNWRAVIGDWRGGVPHHTSVTGFGCAVESMSAG